MLVKMARVRVEADDGVVVMRSDRWFVLCCQINK